jgi:predicted nuclease with TOPRIM domain
MENSAPQGEKQEEKGGKKRGLFIFIAIIAALLAVLSGYLYNQVNTLKKEAELLKTQKEDAVKETDEYRIQLQMLTAKYDSLMQAHEGLRSELEIERQKVIKLMGDYEALKRSGGTVAGPGNAATSMRKRLEELQQTYDESEAIILELKAKNQELTNENFRSKKQLDESTEQNSKLTTENSKLNKTVEIAKRLKTYEVYADAVKVSGGGSKEKQTEKAKKADRIRVCFTVLDNQLADKQEKLIYAVIQGPDKKVFVEGDKSKITLLNGEEVSYSIKKEIFYDNKVMQLCMNWEVKQPNILVAGKYNVEIYCEGVKIGTSDFTLK